jgi:hypothetical protein
MKRRVRAIVRVLALCAAIQGCDDAPPPAPPPEPAPRWTPDRAREADDHARRLATLAPGAAGELSVHLAFGNDADLDLYVTGPDEETVYYANTPGKAGGALVEDQRCTHEGPRVETVRFPAPLAPGRYRVGVDYPHACGDTTAPAPFAVSVDGPGGRVEERGIARHHVFEPVVLELDVPLRGGTRSEGQP